MLLLITHLPTGVDLQMIYEGIKQLSIKIDTIKRENIELTASNAGRTVGPWCAGLHHQPPRFAAIHHIQFTLQAIYHLSVVVTAQEQGTCGLGW